MSVININGAVFVHSDCSTSCECVFQAVVLAEGERTFSCALHGQEVQIVCHDIMQLSTLQRSLAKSYGHLSLRVQSSLILMDSVPCRFNAININACHV